MCNGHSPLLTLSPFQFFVEDHDWLTGNVTSCDEDYYQVTYENARREKCSSQEMSEIMVTPNVAKVEIGARLAVYWEGGGKYYEAIVAREQNTKECLVF